MGSFCRNTSQTTYPTMKVSGAVKKVLEKINNILTSEKKQKLAELDNHANNENFLNEPFEEEIEENLQNELREARLAFMLALSPSSEQTELNLSLNSSVSVTVISGCQQALPQHG